MQADPAGAEVVRTAHADSIRALVMLLGSLLLRPVETRADAESASQDAHDALAVSALLV
jgi:hypothetical protein